MRLLRDVAMLPIPFFMLCSAKGGLKTQAQMAPSQETRPVRQ